MERQGRAPRTHDEIERRLEEAHRATRKLAERSDPAAGEALAMWRRILDDPSLRTVLDDQANDRARPWRVERGAIVFGQPEPPVPPGRPDPPPASSPAPAEQTDPAPELEGVAAPTPPSTRSATRRFPVPLSRFIGRARELRRLTTLTATKRLVTITGPGGCGKSRLVGEFVRGLPPDQDAVLVDLAPVTDPTVVPQEVATALGRQEGGMGSISASMQQASVPFAVRLAEGLRDRHLLLVLDNCEHLLEACGPLVQTLLETCPGMRVVCTSRELLRVDGESIQRLPILTLPPDDAPLDADLRGYEAVQLFLDRARGKRPDFHPGPEEIAVIAELCRGLDGMPYAIELAAARVGVLSPRQLLERLDEQLQWVGGGRRGAGRQRTMQAMIDWSYGTLRDDEQALLRRLAVFRGGCGLKAVQDVCGFAPLGDNGLAPLEALVDKSLVETERQVDGVRYRLLETTRRYADRRLRESGEEDTVRARHRRWCLRLAESAAPHLVGPDQARWADRLDLELENIRAALERRDDGGAAERLRLASELSQFWFIRGHLTESKAHLERVLEENRAPSRERVTALAVAAELALTEGRLDDASRYAHEALPLARHHGNERAESLALRVLAVETNRRRPSTRARDMLLTSRNIALRLGRPSAVGFIDFYLGDFAELQGRYAEAERWYRSAEQVAREAGHLWGLSWALRAYGNFLLHQNRFDEAERRLEESLDLARHVDSRMLVVLALHDLGNAAYRRDEQGWAAHWFESAMEGMADLDEQTMMHRCRASMAKVAVARNDLDAAQRWLRSVDVDAPLLRRPARAQVRRSRGRWYAATQRYAEAEFEHREALGLWYQLRDHRRVIEELESLALLADRTGRRDRAAALHQVTTVARRRLALDPPPVYRHEIEALAAALGEALQPPERPTGVPSVEEAAAAELGLRPR